jgi:large subunit ribosomal protein L25
MSENFEVPAQIRSDTGKGASRRLRRRGLVPGIVYGAHKDPVMISIGHNEIERGLEQEAFYSSLLDLKLDGTSTKVVLKDLQRHPSKPFILHADFQRVSRDEKLRLTVPIHFENEETCAGVKKSGVVAHNLTEIEVSCLPGNLPEFVAVDMTGVDLGDSILVSDLKLPAGVELTHAADLDAPVVMVYAPQAETSDEDESVAGGGEEPAPGPGARTED